MPDEKEVNVNNEEARMPIRTNYPSNAYKSREQKENPKKEEPKKVGKIIKGTVVQRKKSLGKRFLENFIADDMGNIVGYIIHDVLIPAAKSTLEDMVKGGIEILLHGEQKGSRTRRDGGRSYVNYSGYSSPRRDDRDRDRRDMSQRSRARHDFGDLIFPSRGEAETVLSDLVDLTIDYGQATVANLYDFCGITENFTDNKWGWTDLSSASVSRARDGYLLNLPRPILLD